MRGRRVVRDAATGRPHAAGRGRSPTARSRPIRPRPGLLCRGCADRSAGPPGGPLGWSGRRRVGRAGAAAVGAGRWGGWRRGWRVPARALALASRPALSPAPCGWSGPAGSRSCCRRWKAWSSARGAWRSGDGDGDAAGRRARQRGVARSPPDMMAYCRGGRRSHVDDTSLRKIRATVETAATVARINSTSRSVCATKGEPEPLRPASMPAPAMPTAPSPPRTPAGPRIR